METILYGLAAMLALISAGSLLAKNEGIRGAGRVCGGVSTICLGVFLLLLSRGAHSMPEGSTLFSAIVLLTGIVTFASGVRKYFRRNAEADMKEQLRPLISGRPADESNGYARRFERRPEFEVFGSLITEVVDATTLRERPADDLRAVRISDLFSGKDEVFLGFGKPNCYLVCPDGQGEYQKFAGKSLKLEVSKTVPTRDWV
ncbi:MAG: hypothetical protein ACRD3W_04970, partial [Terriglobales bacterium]